MSKPTDRTPGVLVQRLFTVRLKGWFDAPEGQQRSWEWFVDGIVSARNFADDRSPPFIPLTAHAVPDWRNANSVSRLTLRASA